MYMQVYGYLTYLIKLTLTLTIMEINIQLKHIIIFFLAVWLYMIGMDTLNSLEVSNIQRFYNKTIGNVTHSLDYIVINYKNAASSIFATTFAGLVYYAPVISYDFKNQKLKI
jgi:hypothetical protein